MKAQIPWLRVFVEGVVIVLSILLAFGIDAWWDGVQERAEEQQLLVGLRQEIASNHEGLEGDRRNVEEGLGRLRAFVQMGPDEIAAIDPDSVFVAIYEPMRRAYSTRLTTGFLEATVSSGKLALIRDPSLQSALAQLRGIDGDVEELRVLLFDLSRNGAVAVGRHARMASSGGEPPGQGLFGALWGREALRALGNDHDARSVAIAKISYWAGYRVVLGRLMAQLDVVMGMIDAELNDAA